MVFTRHVNKKQKLDAIETDTWLERRDQLRSLVDRRASVPNETVYEQAVRYGKIAHEAYCRVLNNGPWNPEPYFEGLSVEEQQAWIEVGTQIERAVLKDLKE